MLSANPFSIMQHPEHGGHLHEYAEHYGIPQHAWLDVSTGINPKGYLPTNIPDNIWTQLPQENDGLVLAAQKYYGTDQVLMVPGSSWAIQTLPQILQQQSLGIQRVLLPKVGYGEHKKAWLKQKATLDFYDDIPTDEQLVWADACVLINPNNPTTRLLDPQLVVGIAKVLERQHGLLIVDEAFMDAQPHCSVVSQLQENMIVLRSLGKFFGLAGLRVGSVMASQSILQSVQNALPPWAISNVSRYVAKQALSDVYWIAANNYWIQQNIQRLVSICAQAFCHERSLIRASDLFVTVWFDEEGAAQAWHHHLCCHGVYCRLLDENNGLRFGLLQYPEDWQRLHKVMSMVQSQRMLSTVTTLHNEYDLE